MFLSKDILNRNEKRFPRVCGDVPDKVFHAHGLGLFSPRMRGCSVIRPQRKRLIAVFPAYAGMFRLVAKWWVGFLGFPRVCGDVPSANYLGVSLKKFSPRMRGCSWFLLAPNLSPPVFPAYAGMFRSGVPAAHRSASFPRVCGDVPMRPPRRFPPLRFSPRMRGCSDLIPALRSVFPVFPAYAGMFLLGFHHGKF